MKPKTYGQDAAEIRCRLGESFILELPGAPSGGYEWRLEIDEDEVRVDELSAEPIVDGFGADSTQRFKVEPRKSGSSTLRLIYGRPWEDEPLETRTVSLEVSTADGAS